ncbi:hypothetical protein EYF80_026757 [Liparis tanakae]|uniref:Uncharacterized protein n=1 Tax=Liparis tanakae TaxID=230148 RepID=A0A4Z2HB33_9TELE|nr:hypothetical protein EYF80_026757 [Liparis tanakae]
MGEEEEEEGGGGLPDGNRKPTKILKPRATLVYLGSLPFVSGSVAYDQCVCAGSCCPQISTGGRGAPSGLNQMALRIQTKSCRLDICFSVGSAGPEARLQFRGGVDVRTVGRSRIVL